MKVDIATLMVGGVRDIKKAPRKFANLESDPLVIEDNAEDVQDDTQEQDNEIDEHVITENDESQLENEGITFI
ncbi:hypothetical protein L1887_31842 [Cichorium endivia]|nr:hypothetical protein L1887_31842 [Cichorium endivia]